MSAPLYSQAEAQTRETFLALMWSLSYPGRVYHLPEIGTNIALIAETLLDLETSFFTSDLSLRPLLAQNGAQERPVEQAAYHFYPVCGDQELTLIQHASIGTMQYPDDGTTLIIGCALGEGEALILRGPGVNGQQTVHIGGLPDHFWRVREQACRFPLGWDIYFVDGSQIVGLPRSTQVEKLSAGG